MAVTVRRRSNDGYIQAGCLSGDVVGDMVRISADKVGGYYQVAKLDISNSSPHLPVGMIVKKLTTTHCAIQVGGEVVDVYTGMTPGSQLFIDLSSRLSHSIPTHPGNGVKWVHLVAQALSSNTVLLQIQKPSKIKA